MYEEEKEKACAKITQVQNELARAKKIVAESTEMIVKLTGRLVPIVKTGPEEIEPSNRVEKELVPLAREISDINGDLEINSKRISRILDRLEL